MIKSIFNETLNLDILSITPILSVTNKTYLVNANNQYVIRIPRVEFPYPFDYQNELAILSQISTLDAPLVYFDQQGIKVCQYLDNEPYDYLSHLIPIAQKLRQLHQVKVTKIKHFDYHKLLSHFHQEALDSEAKVIEDNSELLKKKHSTLAHNDCLFSNFIKSEGNIVLLDYEYSCLNDPLFDIASLISENNLSPEAQKIFLEAYFENEKIDYETIRRWIILQDIFWYHWALAAYRKYDENIFLNIANEKKKHYLKRLANYFHC